MPAKHYSLVTDNDIKIVKFKLADFEDDISFVECGFEYIAEETITTLNLSVMFPMHFCHNENRYKIFATKMKGKYPDMQFVCSENRGDNFFYKNGIVINF